MIDFAFAAILMIGFLWGLGTGSLRVLSPFAALALISIGLQHRAVLTDFWSRFLGEDSLLIATYLSVILGALAAAWIVQAVIRLFLKLTSSSWIDKLAGGVLGVGAGVAACGILIIGLNTFGPEALEGSRLAGPLNELFSWGLERVQDVPLYSTGQ